MNPSPGVSRRDFVKAAGTAAMAPALAAGPAETPVARLHASLTGEQKDALCFPFDHPLRSVFRNNWKVVEPTIGDLDRGQRALCREIFEGLCSDEGIGRFDRQMREDYGGFANYHVALFGEPGTGEPFEWVLTGRHVTLRADGNRPATVGFGGPIFYGHANREQNVWQPQSARANAILATLDGEQRARALVTRAQADRARAALLRGEAHGETGLAVRPLDANRKAMVRDLLKDLVRPFRRFDAEEIASCINTDAGTDALRLSFFEGEAIGPGAIRPVWKLEGPAFAWFFHGSPHVHAWLNVASEGG